MNALDGQQVMNIVKEYKPDLIYVPEVPFDIEQFLLDVQEIYSKKKRCLRSSFL